MHRPSHPPPWRLALVLATVALPALAQAPAVQVCDLGSFALESGQSIPSLRMTYITHGTLNAEKSNAVLSLHGLRGNRNSQSGLAGPGRAFDTGRYFVVQPDTLGVASLEPNATTSPTRSGLNMEFPRFTMRDMVRAEHRLLTECLGINRLVAVSGNSMGGMGALQWAVSHPDFMAAVIPLVPVARTSPQAHFIWESARQTIMLDPKWRGGAYPADDPPRAGVGLGIGVQLAFSGSSFGFSTRYAEAEAVRRAYADERTNLGNTTDARDWIYRSWAIDSHDIAAGPPFNGDLAAAARSIRARVLLLPNCFDQLLPPREGGVLELAEHIPVAKLVDLDDPAGHSGTATPRSQAIVTAEIRDLLARIADGRPGISGPRFPRGWARTDFCPG